MAGLELPPSLMRQASRTNSRIPPIARRSVSPFPCRMAVLSRDKLQKETSTKSPDLRRCLAHQRLLNRSIEAAQHDVRSRMASYQLEDDDDEITPCNPPAEATAVPIIRVQITNAVRAMVKRRAADQKELGGGLARVSAHSEKPSSTKKSLRNVPRVVFGRRRWAMYGPLQAGVVS
ncbi:hypothetical protein BO94DRAFT_496269 [Aspergillus sclerotioniger CBS 115572]|uniref:Uncharacterized protein n=1 Tax=Aspergillus sclerotioniger CBS 115572 TaxID=1450535 RepID=A0A317W6Y0_9EURO|nr:hypothetical protein BO94DRAFT_496269 [Aspergillus sclerotioniger CBS 115572]PWY80768.1 hypothetical protein BO94DRAFT_496269 [Aspergillus sclerotioniger CBS 115572]